MKFGRTPPLNYAKLLQSCAKKQKSALHALFKAEAGAMMALALKNLEQPQYAEQVVLSSFMSFWDNADYYNSDMGSAKGWLYSILRYQIRQAYQKHYDTVALLHAKEPGFKPDDMLHVQLELNPDQSVLNVYHVFEQLPREQQSSLMSMYFSPDSQAVVATRMGMPLGRFKDDLGIGLHHLAKHLSQLPKHHAIVLLGEYALGSLSDSEIQVVNNILAIDPVATQAVLAWEEIFTQFINQLPLFVSPPSLWKSLQTQIKARDKERELARRKKLSELAQKTELTPDADHDTENDTDQNHNKPNDSAQARKTDTYTALRFFWNNLWFDFKQSLRKPIVWQGITVLCLVLAIAGIFWALKSSSAVSFVAVLTSTQQGQTAGWVVEVDQQGNAVAKTLIEQSPLPNLDLQLWVKANNDQNLRPLRVLNPSGQNQISKQQLGSADDIQYFYISLEPKGGAGGNRPTGSILFQGPLVSVIRSK